MSTVISRRRFAALTTGCVFGTTINRVTADEKPKANPSTDAAVPAQAAFERDYAPPGFKPSWKKNQINHLLV